MTSREKFEAWMTAEQWFHGSDFEWDERRNCYAQFGIHLAYKAFLAAEGAAEQKLTDMAVQLANAESKCREMAAENSRVKLVASNLVSEYISNKGTDCEFISCITPSKNTIGTGGVWDMWRLLDLVLQETPATDAFLAEVRAQGVEMFAEQAAKSLSGGYVIVAKEFAAQLRKGVAL